MLVREKDLEEEGVGALSAFLRNKGTFTPNRNLPLNLPLNFTSKTFEFLSWVA